MDQILEVHASPFRDSSGEMVGAVAVLHDVSELERLETIRQDFVANVSHELKTPITAIRGMLETMIEDKEMSADYHRSFLKKTMNQTLRLSNIVTDLLALSRLESVKMDFIRESIDLRDVVNDSMQALLPLSEDKKIPIELQIIDEPIEILGDREALFQSVNNLIDNAIKYTEGPPKIDVYSEHNENVAILTIQDQGIGMDSATQRMVFEKFYRQEGGNIHNIKGHGLGLSYVKKIVELHRCKIQVESKKGMGTKFIISIPLKPQHQNTD